MPPSDAKNSNALTLLRRAGADMSVMKFAVGTDMSSALTRMILRNIHLAIMSRRQEEIVELNSTENSYAPEQKDGAEPVKKFVRVAMKPSASDKDGSLWDETVNYEKNSQKWAGGLRSNNKKPAFVLREIPYDEWRKHYAKDKTGKYRGTEAPAENCILLPEDEVKWRSEPPQNDGDKTTESEDADPHIEPVKRSATLPVYRDIDPVLSLQSEEDPEVSTQKEEAVFIEADGHAASQIVEVAKDGSNTPVPLTSPISLDPPTSPLSPASPDAPTSPTSPTSKKTWKDRLEKSTRFSKLTRSSSAKTIQ